MIRFGGCSLRYTRHMRHTPGRLIRLSRHHRLLPPRTWGTSLFCPRRSRCTTKRLARRLVLDSIPTRVRLTLMIGTDTNRTRRTVGTLRPRLLSTSRAGWGTRAGSKCTMPKGLEDRPIRAVPIWFWVRCIFCLKVCIKSPPR